MHLEDLIGKYGVEKGVEKIVGVGFSEVPLAS